MLEALLVREERKEELENKIEEKDVNIEDLEGEEL